MKKKLLMAVVAILSPLNSVEIYKALLNAGVKQSSLHIFPYGGHNISLRDTHAQQPSGRK